MIISSIFILKVFAKMRFADELFKVKIGNKTKIFEWKNFKCEYQTLLLFLCLYDACFNL